MALFKDFSRTQHFFVGIGLGLLFTIVTVIIAASAAEYKDDAHGGRWDWGDWICTVLGGLVGQAVQVGIVMAIIFVHWPLQVVTLTAVSLVELLALDDTGFQFMGWSDGNSQNPRTVIPSRNLRLEASFLDLSKI